MGSDDWFVEEGLMCKKDHECHDHGDAE